MLIKQLIIIILVTIFKHIYIYIYMCVRVCVCIKVQNDIPLKQTSKQPGPICIWFRFSNYPLRGAAAQLGYLCPDDPRAHSCLADLLFTLIPVVISLSRAKVSDRKKDLVERYVKSGYDNIMIFRLFRILFRFTCVCLCICVCLCM